MAAILRPDLIFIVKVLANFHHREELANFMRKCWDTFTEREGDLNCGCVQRASPAPPSPYRQHKLVRVKCKPPNFWLLRSQTM